MGNTRNKANLGPNYEVTTPYASVDLGVLQFRQINSVMYIVHPSYPPAKLSCFSDTNWTLDTVDWTYPALLDQNLNQAEPSLVSPFSQIVFHPNCT